MRPPARSLACLALGGILALGLAACSGGGDGESTSADVEPDVSVMGTDTLKFEPETLTAEAGEVAVELEAESGVRHNFVVDDETVVEVAAGGAGVGTIELEAGDHTFYCSIPGHRTAGMEGTLTVE